MDHLLLPEGVEPYIVVPYKCTEDYDGGDFLTYPERKGWDKDIANDDYSGRTPAELDAFFQTWLFFGCLTEIFKAGQVEFDVEDFIDRRTNTITTKKLPQLMVQWKQRWPSSKDVSSGCQCNAYQIYSPEKRCKRKRCWQSVVRDRNVHALRTSRRICFKVYQLVNRLCGTAGREENYSFLEPIPVQPEIALSISALGTTLFCASTDIYHAPPGRENWGGTSIMKERLLQANWCPSRVVKTMALLDVDGRYYCAADPLKEEGDHSQCNTRTCVAQTVDFERDYPTKHIPGCTCEGAGVSMEELLSIIRRDSTPIVTWVTVKGEGDTPGYALASVDDALNNQNLEAAEPTTPHVSRYVTISHVWTDGLGNPTGNTLPICQLTRIQKMVDDLFTDLQPDEHVPFWMDTLCVPVHDDEARKKCIIRMRTIYEQSTAVLVLDGGVQEISCAASIYDRCIRMYQSGWWRRLWTYQEGILPNQVYFRFSDGSQDVVKISEERAKRGRQLEEQGYYDSLSFADITGNFTLFKWRDGMSRDMFYLPVAEAVSSRRTTRDSDETLCLSTALGINPAPLLELSVDKAQLVDRRMELFLSYISKFHRGIIFNGLPRLKRDGFRWAPRSLMGHGRGDMGENDTKSDPRDHDYHAIMHKDRRGVEGLLLHYPGVRLMPVTSQLRTTFVFGDGDARYRVRLLLDESADFAGWDEAAHYCLVLAGNPDADKSKQPSQEHPTLISMQLPEAEIHGTMAVLGIRKDLLSLGHTKLRYECRAWVESLKGHQSYDVEGEVVEQLQWFIL